MSDQNSDEREAFLREMRDVKPIKAEQRVPLKKDRVSALSDEQRRAAAVAEQAGEKNFLSGDHVPPVDPLDVLAFKRSGVQNGVYRKLRQGKYALDARLDLHRMTVDQARRSVYQFVEDCMEQDIRCALITHGKGLGRAHPALLKSCVAHWLPQFQHVMAFHSALPAHGGTGATYVLLRKSERKRQENWERQHKRRG
ncbi:DNA endonuclease SmrA [Marinimicrobium sp. ABcell2]|uniref:DNA endonuclease SmrA n=1 Tax=Marinimicrobium sp. ABcell2 TaxID=3069751 RepID=UPI0027B4856A|nr:DNA endonuclease SmrA [Marinimicrobium sp. ABcell2]MDQ2076459.1 DNA endonuclease SmrA [Marinimicrobium sp. ABcell2]